MRSFLSLAATLALLARQATAQGIIVNAPASGAKLAAGLTTITVADSGTAPGIALLTSADIALVVGGNTPANSKQLAVLGTITYPAVSLAVQIAPGLASSVNNGFYLKITSNINSGGTVVNYSQRFSISGMTGTTEQTFIAAAAAAGAAVPALVYTPGAAQNGGNNQAVPSGDQYGTPFNAQVGPTRYAPMQPVPPTRITAGGNPTPLFPTSAYTIATTWLPPNPSIKTTLTQQQTASYDSVENPAPAQSLPTGDMARFLQRWKD